MHNLNLKHLRYFWSVATHGSIARAAEALFITPQTISGQISDLEKQVGKKLFKREGRNLVMTDTGQLVFSYADEMFRLGNELQDVLAGHTPGASITLKVGIAMIVPKLLAYRVLEPVLHMSEQVRLICNEAPLVDLLADLSVHKLDVVLADSPTSPVLNIRAYNHELGQSGITFYSVPEKAEAYRENFPSSIDGAKMLMPSHGSHLRRSLETWFEKKEINPLIIAEFEDRALMKAFGEADAGIFTTPTAVKEDVLQKYGVEVIGETEEISERFFLISAERHIKNPAVSLITETARNSLFK
jgi:LysR family transcriptional activator of nhaA